jgi:hypothetical protein
MHQALVVFKGEDGDEAINTANYPEKCVKSNHNRSKDQQSLKEIL